MSAVSLPRLHCGRVHPGLLCADPEGSVWRNVVPVTLRDNLTAGVPAQGTRVYTVWEDRGWRVLFEVDDALPWATLTAHDAPLWTEEVVEVFVDPFGDLESYFEVEINPLGAVVDLVLRRSLSGWRKDFAWHVAGLECLVRRTSAGWAAELLIPFDAIAAAGPRAGTAWRVNFLRIDRPRGPGSEAELSAWSPTGVRNFHRAEYFGTMEFAGS